MLFVSGRAAQRVALPHLIFYIVRVSRTLLSGHIASLDMRMANDCAFARTLFPRARPDDASGRTLPDRS
jgi:hypothetical protein